TQIHGWAFVTVVRLAGALSSRVAGDSLPARSLSTAVAAVTMARSSINALRRSPKYGDFTPTTFRDLRMELTTSICRGSPSMSSAMISTSLPDWAICSRTGRKSGRLEIFSRTSRTRVLQDGLTGVSVGDEVRGQEALVEGQAFGDG